MRMQTPEAKERSNGLPSCPSYPNEFVEKVHRFLAACLTEYEIKLCRIKEMAGRDIDHPLFKGQVDYCLHAIGAIKYLAYKVTCKQAHLLDVTDEEIQQCLSEMDYQSSNSPVPVRLETSACIMTLLEERIPTGSVSNHTQKENSEQHHREQYRPSSNGRNKHVRGRKS